MPPPPALAGTAPCTAGTAIDCAPDAFFKQAFNVYRTIVDAGLLGHATLAGAAVGQLRAVQAAAGGAPLAVLDAGCGDAGALAAALASAGGSALVSAYDGLDASPPALAAAAPTMAGALGQGACVRTAVGDLLGHLEGAAAALGCGGPGAAAAAAARPPPPPSVAAMPPPPGGYGAIVATLSVHHLDTAAKARWVKAAASCLAPGGALVVGDVFLEEGNDADTVDAWRARSTAVMRSAWPAASGLPARECDSLAAHVAACDMPEPVGAYERMMREAGLERFEVVARVDPGACGGIVIPCTMVVGRKKK